MEIESLVIPAIHPFASQYSADNQTVMQFFHYYYKNAVEYIHRLEELTGRTFKRDVLAEHISSYMRPFPSSEKVVLSLEKLRQGNSVVILGGQQAGILTGPLYTIHKIISILAFSRQKEKELGVPVVPVFWIAGEDHDYEEVNHVYFPEKGRMEKYLYPEKSSGRRMISDFQLDKEICLEWTKSLIKRLGETQSTNELLRLVEAAIISAKTFTDFFAYLIMALFKEQGLLVIDSGDFRLRQLEKEIFLQQIELATKINQAVHRQQKEVSRFGFAKMIEQPHRSANLFYYDEKHHERILLAFDEERKGFVGRTQDLFFTTEELVRLARKEPEKLSNNVVTRTVTQELLFPVLAFIAGPGEIAYWAELKQVFEQFHIKMPIIVPRLNITLLERESELLLSELGLELSRVLQHGVSSEQAYFLEGVKDREYTSLFAETKERLQLNYRLIHNKLAREHPGLLPLLEKNKSILLKELAFMEDKINKQQMQKHELQLQKYVRLENNLRPLNSPQERIWNIVYFLNKYGLNFIEELCQLEFTFDGSHKIVKL